MFEIKFLPDEKGQNETYSFIEDLDRTKDKNKQNRVLLNKIYFYIELVKKSGTRAGDEIIKHIKGKIWELRPIDFRILLYIAKDSKIYVLNYFRKKTDKTPKREIEKAERMIEKFFKE